MRYRRYGVRFANEPLTGKILEKFILDKYSGGRRLETLPYEKAVYDETRFVKLPYGKELYDWLVYDEKRIFEDMIKQAVNAGANRSEVQQLCDKMRNYVLKRYKDEIIKVAKVRFALSPLYSVGVNASLREKEFSKAHWNLTETFKPIEELLEKNPKTPKAKKIYEILKRVWTASEKCIHDLQEVEKLAK